MADNEDWELLTVPTGMMGNVRRRVVGKSIKDQTLRKQSMKNLKIRLKKRIQGGNLETRRTCLGTQVKSGFLSVSEQTNIVRHQRSEVSIG